MTNESYLRTWLPVIHLAAILFNQLCIIRQLPLVEWPVEPFMGDALPILLKSSLAVHSPSFTMDSGRELLINSITVRRWRWWCLTEIIKFSIILARWRPGTAVTSPLGGITTATAREGSDFALWFWFRQSFKLPNNGTLNGNSWTLWQTQTELAHCPMWNWDVHSDGTMDRSLVHTLL